jgi:hypothetical protein
MPQTTFRYLTISYNNTIKPAKTITKKKEQGFTTQTPTDLSSST